MNHFPEPPAGVTRGPTYCHCGRPITRRRHGLWHHTDGKDLK